VAHRARAGPIRIRHHLGRTELAQLRYSEISPFKSKLIEYMGEAGSGLLRAVNSPSAL